MRSTNPHGTRVMNVAVSTLMRRPAAPVGSITLSGSKETITVDVHPLDRFNATDIYGSCWGMTPTGHDFWSAETNVPYRGEPVVFTRDTSAGRTAECRVYALNLQKGMSPMALIRPGRPATDGGGDGPTGGTDDDGGTVNTVPVDNPIALSVKATRFQRGRYVVRWTARSRDGMTVTVTVPKFGSRKCVPRTRTSCVVVGLRPGKTYKVVFVGKTSVASKKVNFSIRAR
jgi:hypothetical protein